MKQGDIFKFQDVKGIREVLILSPQGNTSTVMITPLKEVTTKYFNRKHKAICVRDISVMKRKQIEEYLLDKIGSIDSKDLEAIGRGIQDYVAEDIILKSI